MEGINMKSMVRVAILGVTLLLMAGCGRMGDVQSQSKEGDSSAASQAHSGGKGSASSCEAGEPLEISAAETAFDKECLAAPADKAFKVTFNNKDSFGHSFAVYDKEGGEQLFRGEIFRGPKELVNDIPALPAGSYHFQCDVHPFVMQGALKVS